MPGGQIFHRDKFSGFFRIPCLTGDCSSFIFILYPYNYYERDNTRKTAAITAVGKYKNTVCLRVGRIFVCRDTTLVSLIIQVIVCLGD